jgi:ABC-type multidrug transport system fused ATPase/permease subunit
MAARHWWVLTLDSVCNALWAGAQGLTPAAIGAAVQAGLVARNQTALIWWGLAVLFLGVAQAVFAMFVERLEMKARVESGYQTLRFVTRQVCDLGAAVGQRVSAGDLVTVGVSDITLIGEALAMGARGVGGVIAFAAVAVLMLVSSWPVGLLVLVAVPLILFVTTRLSRLLREQQRQVRGQQRELADQAVDIVRGLRVLRGFGGEEMFAGRYRDRSQRLRQAALGQARASALLGAATMFLPGILLVGVVTLAGELVLSRELTAGQLVAFYGYATWLTFPLNRMTYAVTKAMQAHVAAANITRLLRMKPDIDPRANIDPRADIDPRANIGPSPGAAPGPGMLADPESGLAIPARGFTAVVCSPADAIALSDRLGRYTESGVTYDGRPLAALPLAAVRKEILVTPGAAHLFAGPLRRELDPADTLAGLPAWQAAPADGAGTASDTAKGTASGATDGTASGTADGTAADDPLWTAIDAASARDIIEALPDQLETSVAAGGRQFSGGQQQRLRLVRSLMADPGVLILIDPTSAVDATTEAAMAAGIEGLRRDRATVVFTTSSLLLHQAGHVVLVVDGSVAAEGTHDSLLPDPRYRSYVERGGGGRMSEAIA